MSVNSGALFHELNRYEEETYLTPPEKLEIPTFEESHKNLLRKMKSTDDIFWGNGYRVPLVSERYQIFGFLDRLRKDHGEWGLIFEKQAGGASPNIQMRAAITLLVLREMGIPVETATILCYQGEIPIDWNHSLQVWVENTMSLVRFLKDRGRALTEEINTRPCGYCTHYHCRRKQWLRELPQGKEGWIEV